MLHQMRLRLSGYNIPGSKILFLLVIFIICPFVYGGDHKPVDVSIGVFADRGVDEAKSRWQPTIRWLNKQIPEFRFHLIALELEALQAEVSAQRLQFIIINPSESIRLGRLFPLSWIATLISPLKGGTSEATGSVLWVRSDAPYQRVNELSGKSIGTVNRQAFGGFMAMAHEVLAPEFPVELLSEVKEIGYPHEKVVRALQEKRIEAAILPVCLVESMIENKQLEPASLRALGNRAPAGFQCQVSTRLYPNWGFAMTGNADRQLAKKIVQHLLAMQGNSPEAKAAQSLGWTVPENQVELDRLFKDLGLHPLQRPWWQQVKLWLVQHYYILLIAIILLTVLPVQYMLLSFRFRCNNIKLRQMQDSLQQIQRQSLVDKLGSSLAHELNQPLSAIRLYAEGELSRQKKGNSQTNIEILLTKIRDQVVRIDDLVKRLRKIMRKEPTSKGWFDLSQLLQETCTLVSLYAERFKVDIRIQNIPQTLPFFGDRTGLEQLIVNLLTNAIDASAGAGNHLVFINITQTKMAITLCIQDQGDGLCASQAELMVPFVTSKVNGVGLGLTVCRDVVEAHQGTFCLKNCSNNGVEAIVCFPLIEEDSHAA
ncbi:sensor histidine kinase [Shimwellia blattae]|uniref:histidine kinase n=1 Tax=Shimwellia blattae (strain ATCC 29907 / DSM 4481 / JCM 1650 / NBRC 105725 / CDC 9005-74) TaxID=630626 RepID=I2B613_SHIBC|nr:sensor histidine kinase [Shimwellia blattae]AFJ45967.1 putative sensor protein [Shimwellia blattae DSM 4481 = NBRC 105725]GAB81722.1 putative histidine kinase [Shimwellia blattae DSM 4481 = NBRC 105725]VDY63443.1 Sensor protein fixL [Shimwellia blattae]VEC21341.1 Sensor protein fixL [Shimwellia blattae]